MEARRANEEEFASMYHGLKEARNNQTDNSVHVCEDVCITYDPQTGLYDYGFWDRFKVEAISAPASVCACERNE